MKKVDIKILARYENQYVGISEDSSKIFASGKTIKTVENKLEKLEIKDAVIRYIPPVDKALSLPLA